jgi:tRNA dimethylallyltransferase
VIEHVRGHRDLEETVESVKARTRQFARRQETWFRSLSECRPVLLQDDVSDRDMARRIAEMGQ